ncbi:MAG TPA: hypothetical protein VMB50_10605 [Myxococcales bacterium]|nr:hypothetical protein [Myxococcales bacterium]
MNRILAACLAALLAAAPPSLAHAIAAFNNFQDDEAAVELERIVRFNPTSEDAAKAHLYLGLIALNALDSKRARKEFEAALAIEPTLEVPYEASPKARVVFDQAQKEFAAESNRVPRRAAPSGPVGVQGNPVPVVVEGNGAPSAPRSKVPGIVLSALAAATLGVGVGFGVAQSQTLKVSDASQIPSAESQAGTQGIVADVCFGVGGGLGIAAVAVLVTELTGGGGSATALRVVPGPGGAAAAFAF